jgi:hypothetical protein
MRESNCRISSSQRQSDSDNGTARPVAFTLHLLVPSVAAAPFNSGAPHFNRLLVIRHLHRETIIVQKGRCKPNCGDEKNKSLDLHLRKLEMEGNDKRRGV